MRRANEGASALQSCSAVDGSDATGLQRFEAQLSSGSRVESTHAFSVAFPCFQRGAVVEYNGAKTFEIKCKRFERPKDAMAFQILR